MKCMTPAGRRITRIAKVRGKSPNTLPRAPAPAPHPASQHYESVGKFVIFNLLQRFKPQK